MNCREKSVSNWSENLHFYLAIFLHLIVSVNTSFDNLEDKGLISYDLRWKNVPDLEISENDNPSIIWGLDIHAHALKYPMMYANYDKAKKRFDWYMRGYEKEQLVGAIEYGEKKQLYATFKDKQVERARLDLIRLPVNGDPPVGK